MNDKNKTSSQEQVLLSITDFTEQGEGVGKNEQGVWFVPHVIPGDYCRVQTIKRKKNYLLGKVIDILQPSPFRKNPVCIHFRNCGGCAFQHTEYSFQLEWKRRRVQEIFRRIGKMDVSDKVMPVIPSEKTVEYRNKLDFSFSSRSWIPAGMLDDSENNFSSPALGFHVRGHFDKVLHLQQCHLQASPSDAIRSYIFDFFIKKNIPFFNIRQQNGVPRSLIIRNNLSGECMMILSFYENQPEIASELCKDLQEKFPQITGFLYYHNPKGNDTLYDLKPVWTAGRTYHTEVVNQIEFRYGPLSFFQVNVPVAEKIFRTAMEWACLKGKEVVWDLYCGVGFFSLLFAQKAGFVVGIESMEEAIQYARENTHLNNISNTRFFSGDVKKILLHEKNIPKPDIILCDPPRSGIDKKVLEIFLQLAPQKIIYISCNPATQARDVEILSSKYILTHIQPFDMFPQTPHIENVCVLERK